MKPTKIILEKTQTHFQLRVLSPTGTAKGYSVIETVPIHWGAPGGCLPTMRKQAQKYAKRFSIPFEDQTNA